MGSVCSNTHKHTMLEQNMLTSAPSPSAGKQESTMSLKVDHVSRVSRTNRDLSRCDLPSGSLHASQTPKKHGNEIPSKMRDKKSPMRKFFGMFKKKRKREDGYDDETEETDTDNEWRHKKDEGICQLMEQFNTSHPLKTVPAIEPTENEKNIDGQKNHEEQMFSYEIKNLSSKNLHDGMKSKIPTYKHESVGQDYSSTCAGDSEKEVFNYDDHVPRILNMDTLHTPEEVEQEKIIKRKESPVDFQHPVRKESETGYFYSGDSDTQPSSSVISMRVDQGVDMALDMEEISFPEPSQKPLQTGQDWRTHSLNIEIVYQGRRLSSAEKDWLGEQVAGLLNILLNKGKIPENFSLVKEEKQEPKIVQYQEAGRDQKLNEFLEDLQEQYVITPTKNKELNWHQDEDSDDTDDIDLTYDPYGLKQQKYENREKKRARAKFGSVIQELSRRLSQETMKISDSTSSASTFHSAKECLHENNHDCSKGKLPNPAAAASRPKSPFVRVSINEVKSDPEGTSPKIEFQSKSEPFIYAGQTDEKICKDVHKRESEIKNLQQTTISASSPHVFRIEEDKSQKTHPLQGKKISPVKAKENYVRNKVYSPRSSTQWTNKIQNKVDKNAVRECGITLELRNGSDAQRKNAKGKLPMKRIAVVRISDTSSSSSASSVIEFSKGRNFKQNVTLSHSRKSTSPYYARQSPGRSMRTPTPVGAHRCSPSHDRLRAPSNYIQVSTTINEDISQRHNSSPRLKQRSRHTTPVMGQQESPIYEYNKKTEVTSPVTIISDRRTPLIFQRVNSPSPVSMRPEPLSFLNMDDRNMKREKILKKVVAPTPIYAKDSELIHRKENRNYTPIPKPRTRITHRPVPAPRTKKLYRRQPTPVELLEGKISPRPSITSNSEGEQIDIPQYISSSSHRVRRPLSSPSQDIYNMKPTKLPSDVRSKKQSKEKDRLRTQDKNIASRKVRDDVPQNMVPLIRTPAVKKYKSKQKSSPSQNFAEKVQEPRKIQKTVRLVRSSELVDAKFSNVGRQTVSCKKAISPRTDGKQHSVGHNSRSPRILNEIMSESKKKSPRKTPVHTLREMTSKGPCPPQFIENGSLTSSVSRHSGEKPATKKQSRVTFKDEPAELPCRDIEAETNPTANYDHPPKMCETNNQHSTYDHMQVQNENIPSPLPRERPLPGFIVTQYQNFQFSNYQPPVFSVTSPLSQGQQSPFTGSNPSQSWSLAQIYRPQHSYFSPYLTSTQMRNQQQIYPTPSRISVSGCYFPTSPEMLGNQPFSLASSSVQCPITTGVFNTMPPSNAIPGTTYDGQDPSVTKPIPSTAEQSGFRMSGTLSAPTTPRTANKFEFPSNNISEDQKAKSDDKIWRETDTKLATTKSSQRTTSETSLDKTQKTRKWRQIVKERDEINAWWMPKDWARERGIGNFSRNQWELEIDDNAKKEKELEIAKDANIEQIRMSRFVPL